MPLSRSPHRIPLLVGAINLLALVGTITYFLLKPDHITLVTDEWCPFNCAAESDRSGFMIEMARAALGRHDVTVDYKIMPWSEAIEAVRAGKYDGIIGASRSDAPDFVFHKQPAAQMYTGFFTRGNVSWRYNDLQSLEKVRLAVIRNYSYGEPLDGFIKAQENNPKRLVITDGDNALQQNIDLLLAGKVDVVAEDEAVMRYKLTEEKLTNRIFAVGDLGLNSATNLFIAFGPLNINARRYTAMLDQEIPLMRKRGEMKAIFDRYHTQDLLPELN